MIPILLPLIIFLLLFSSPVVSSNFSEGRDLHDVSCVSCHGDEMYMRDSSKIHSQFDLRRQVSFCSNHLSTEWFPNEESDVVEYLNLKFYKLEH